MEILKGKLGTDISYDVSIAEGTLTGKLEAQYSVDVVVDLVATVIKKIIPGNFEDAAVDKTAAIVKSKLK